MLSLRSICGLAAVCLAWSPPLLAAPVVPTAPAPLAQAAATNPAADVSAAPAVPAPAPSDPIFAVARHRLPNGLEVFVKPRSTTRAVDVRVVVKVGFRHEAVRDSGLSHLLEHMMFKGTWRYDEISLARLIDSKGAYSNGETWPENTFYEVNVVDRHFPLAVDWLREILQESRLDAKDLEAAREDVYSEQEGNYPGFVESLLETGFFQPLELRVPDVLFPGVELPDRAISRLEHVDQKVLRAWYQRFYAPNAMAVIIVGNVDEADALRRAVAAFGSLAARQVVAPDYVHTPRPQLPKGEIRTRLMPPVGEMSELWRGVVTGGLGDPDRFTLRVIQTWLDRRLFEEIRSKRALGYAVGCRSQEVGDVGLLYGYARVKRSSAAEATARQILRDLFHQLAEQPMPAAELQEAKDTILGRQARLYESNAALASLYQEWFLRIPYDQPLPDYFAAVSAVSAADVQRVARARFGDAATFTALSRPTLSYMQAALLLSLLVLVLALLVVRRRLRARRATASTPVAPAEKPATMA